MKNEKNKMKKKTAAAAVSLLAAAALLSGCAGTDVVKKYSRTSFDTIIGKYPELVKKDTVTEPDYELSKDGETILKISSDYKQSGEHDIIMETPLKPFADAGLNQSKLQGGYSISGNTLLMSTDFGNGSGAEDNISDALFESVNLNRNVLTYHQKLDHFGIKLSEGKFEWAKNYLNNDKDLVFVMRADPLKKMGVDPSKVQGWTFTTVQDTDGSNVNVILKAYDLNTKK